MEQVVQIAQFFDGEGRIVKLPRKPAPRIAVLTVLAAKFELGRMNTEPEVNRLCDEWHTFGDYFLLRRELIDHGLLCRTPDGARYWRATVADEPRCSGEG